MLTKFLSPRIMHFWRIRPGLIPVLLLLLCAQVAVLRVSIFSVLGLGFLWILLAYYLAQQPRLFRQVIQIIFLVVVLYFFIYQREQTDLLRQTGRYTSDTYQVKIENVTHNRIDRTLAGKALINSGPAKGLRVYIRGPLNSDRTIYSGQILTVNARFERLTAARVPGGFSSSAWLVKQGCYAQLSWWDEDSARIEAVQGRRRPVINLFLRLRDQLTSRLLRASGREAGGVTAAMLYGDESYLPGDSEEEFRDFGLSHVLVASGTNVSLCLSALSPLSRRLVRKPRSRLYFQLASLLLLTGISIGQAAMLRAALMKAIELAYHHRGRRTISDNYLYLSILLIGLFQPRLLISSGFLMSCCATQAVYLQASSEQTNFISSKIRLYLSIQLFLLPFSWQGGRDFLPIRLIANLLLLPLTEILLVWAFIFLLLGFGPIAAWLGMALRILYQGLELLFSVLSGLKGTGLFFDRMILVGLPLIPYHWLFGSRRKAHYRLKQLVCCVLIFLGVTFYRLSLHGLYFLDAGQGDASLFWNGKTAILIDSGPQNFSRDLEAFLKFLEIRKIDYCVLTHLDQDHSEALNVLLQNGLEVKNIVLGAHSAEDEEKVASLRASIHQGGGGSNILTIETGQSLGLEDFRLVFLEPLSETADRNDSGLVFFSDFRGVRALWMGDAGFAAEEQLLAREMRLEADILHVAHHGAATATSEEFLAAVKPQVALISVGYRNRYGHPKPEVLEVLQRYAYICRTDLEGSWVLRKRSLAPALAKTVRELYLPDDYAKIRRLEG